MYCRSKTYINVNYGREFSSQFLDVNISRNMIKHYPLIDKTLLLVTFESYAFSYSSEFRLYPLIIWLTLCCHAWFINLIPQNRMLNIIRYFGMTNSFHPPSCLRRNNMKKGSRRGYSFVWYGGGRKGFLTISIQKHPFITNTIILPFTIRGFLVINLLRRIYQYRVH